MPKTKRYIAGICMLAALTGYMLYQDIRRQNTQTVLVNAVSEQALNSDAAHTDTIVIRPKQELVPGKTYRLAVTYDMEPAGTSRIFTQKKPKTENKVSLGCSRLKTEQFITAEKKHLAVRITLTIQGRELAGADGERFQYQTHTLYPNIKLTEVEGF